MLPAEYVSATTTTYNWDWTKNNHNNNRSCRWRALLCAPHIEREKRRKPFFHSPVLICWLCGDKDRIGKKCEKCAETGAVCSIHSGRFGMATSVWGTVTRNYALVNRMKYYGSGSHIYNYSIMHMRACSHERWHSIQIKQSQLFAIVPRRSSSDFAWKQCSPEWGERAKIHSFNNCYYTPVGDNIADLTIIKSLVHAIYSDDCGNTGTGKKLSILFSAHLKLCVQMKWRKLLARNIIASIGLLRAVSVSNQVVLFIIVFLMSLSPIPSYPLNFYPATIQGIQHIGERIFAGFTPKIPSINRPRI